jgi:biotin carboxylase
MQRKSVVVLGGNQMALPAVERIRERGFAVIAVDGNAAAPAGRVADEFVHQNFTDVDGTVRALADFSFDGVVPLNDFAIHAASRIAHDRKLPGWNEFAERCFTSKAALKRAWMAGGLPTARCAFATVPELMARRFPNWAIWPAVVKPSFSGGGSRGVFVARDWDEVHVRLSQVLDAYLDRDVVIEEYIKGTEHTLEVLVCRGTPTLLSISDKENYPESDTVVQKLYFPGPVGNSFRSRLTRLIAAATESMRLTDGTTHFEVLIRDGEPFLLEVGGRPGGGLNLHPICELSTGYDYPGLLADVLTGGEPNFRRKPAEHLVWHYFPAGNGELISVSGFDQVKNEPDVVDAMVYEEVGKPRLDLRNDLARPGYVLVRSRSAAHARDRASALVQRVKFVASSPNAD